MQSIEKAELCPLRERGVPSRAEKAQDSFTILALQSNFILGVLQGPGPRHRAPLLRPAGGETRSALRAAPTADPAPTPPLARTRAPDRPRAPRARPRWTRARGAPGVRVRLATKARLGTRAHGGPGLQGSTHRPVMSAQGFPVGAPFPRARPCPSSRVQRAGAAALSPKRRNRSLRSPRLAPQSRALPGGAGRGWRGVCAHPLQGTKETEGK